MSCELLDQLEAKINETIETIEIMRLQIEELETNNLELQENNNILKAKQADWEKNLQSILSKLNSLNSEIKEKDLESCN